MTKTLKLIDIRPTDADLQPNLVEPSSELEPEFGSNSTRTPLSFPCTRVEASKALGGERCNRWEMD
ncbi:MAG: hypothetical protein SVX43_10960 [Cyanobacteriota bacterium]|nr:hypothetical protein [Cyanobacteriota bacterium]